MNTRKSCECRYGNGLWISLVCSEGEGREGKIELCTYAFTGIASLWCMFVMYMPTDQRSCRCNVCYSFGHCCLGNIVMTVLCDKGLYKSPIMVLLLHTHVHVRNDWRLHINFFLLSCYFVLSSADAPVEHKMPEVSLKADTYRKYGIY